MPCSLNNDNGRTARATEVAFNNDAGVATLTWLKSLYDKGYLYYSGKKDGDSWQTVDDAFLPGTEVAMAIYSSSEHRLLHQHRQGQWF